MAGAAKAGAAAPAQVPPLQAAGAEDAAEAAAALYTAKSSMISRTLRTLPLVAQLP